MLDCHLHLFLTREQSDGVIASYPITEYGEGPAPEPPLHSGSVTGGIEALDHAGIDRAFLLGSWEAPGLPFPPGDARDWPADPPHASDAQSLREANAWLCDVGRDEPRLLPFINVHPCVMSQAESAAHVRELHDTRGAVGVKLHTIAMRTHPADPAMAGVYSVCAELGMPVLAHCGPDRHGRGWSMPEAFIPVLDEHPRLKLVLAHLGGGAWRSIATVAERFEQVWFDLSEINAWTGAELAPTSAELAELIRTVGTHRVLAGSDFPWYEPADMVARVRALPGLDDAEVEAILGQNAQALLER